MSSWLGGAKHFQTSTRHTVFCSQKGNINFSAHFWSAIRLTHIKTYPCICPAPKLNLFQLQFFSFKKEVAGRFPRKRGKMHVKEMGYDKPSKRRSMAGKKMHRDAVGSQSLILEYFKLYHPGAGTATSSPIPPFSHTLCYHHFWHSPIW